MDEEHRSRQRGRKRWTEEEDSILYEEAMKQSTTGNVRDWHRIATKLPGRTNKDCRKRWVNKVCGGLKKGLWDPEEDRRLQSAVEKHGLRWPLIAAEVGYRSPDQCAKRWQYGLDPRLKHREWTAEEDKLLLSLVEERGREWKAIQHSHYPSRSRIDLKNRYTILMRRLNNPNHQDAFQDDDGSDTSSIISGGDASDDGTGTTAATTVSNHSGSSSHHRHSRQGSKVSGASDGQLAAQSHAQSQHVELDLGTEHQHVEQLEADFNAADWLDSSAFALIPTTTAQHGGGVDPLSLTSFLDHHHNSGLRHDTNMLASAWDDPFSTSAESQGYHGMAGFHLSTSTYPQATGLTTATIAPNDHDAGKGDVEMEGIVAFDPNLLLSDPSAAQETFGSRPMSVTAAQDQGLRSEQNGGGEIAGAEEEDLSKVVIAVEGCDKDTLDYLFNVTRPIKGRVKMEITM
ncbi:Homeodomain-like protein [Triangularia setosa]|uniref:Homeodomain-like protein n=1 Tax=Triangularia setosa TaxID=2587417 RepID=A0AAN7A3G1_9PEZI|nr:Homeodomain-like protein [Podospora setosa]